MTADYGRDKAQDREDYLAGITNLTELCQERGIDFAQHVAQRSAENAALKAAGLPVPIPNPNEGRIVDAAGA
jgi:thiamine monophosphate synthase